MAITAANQSSSIGRRIIKDTDATGTVVYNCTGAAGRVYMMYIDHSDHSQNLYLKFWDATKGVTLGTTAPDYIFFIAGSSREIYNFPSGLLFSTGISYACVAGGGTASSEAPTSPPTLYLITS